MNNRKPLELTSAMFSFLFVFIEKQPNLDLFIRCLIYSKSDAMLLNYSSLRSLLGAAGPCCD
jgi:hypothetical protein